MTFQIIVISNYVLSLWIIVISKYRTQLIKPADFEILKSFS